MADDDTPDDASPTQRQAAYDTAQLASQSERAAQAQQAFNTGRARMAFIHSLLAGNSPQPQI